MNFLSVKDFSKEEILDFIKRALEFKKGAKLNLNLPIINIFLEPSTRTLLSFERAQSLLGMEKYSLPVESSSFKKGESLEDTLLNLKSMGINNFVIRNSEEEYWKDINIEGISIINGGDGKLNHPSQALLDATTIFEEFNTLENLEVVISGDIKNSRVYHSLKDLLEKFGSTVKGIGPKEFGGSDESLDKEITTCDVLVMLRIQHERHKSKFTVDSYNERFGLNAKSIQSLKDKAIFMHPGPVNRGVEITEDVLYKSDKSRILPQVENGVYCRMAILEKICKSI